MAKELSSLIDEIKNNLCIVVSEFSRRFIDLIGIRQLRAIEVLKEKVIELIKQKNLYV
ncbi:MAG: hypothetical protein QW779_04965 [Nitrososphaerales archaeon]